MDQLSCGLRLRILKSSPFNSTFSVEKKNGGSLFSFMPIFSLVWHYHKHKIEFLLARTLSVVVCNMFINITK